MEWRLEPSYLEMHLPSFLPRMITERPPAGGQAQGSRMGPGEGQDTDVPNGELHCVMFNRTEGLFSCLVERVWWLVREGCQRAQLRLHGSGSKVQVTTETRNVSCYLLQFCPDAHMKPLPGSHLQVTKHRERK